MTRGGKPDAWSICRRLGVGDQRRVEIESKRRVVPDEAKDLRKFLLKLKRARHEGTLSFFDQFLDTKDLALLRKGASLRLRYKGGGARVYLQYKGPGFHQGGLLYRSEFSSGRLERIVREESRHDVVHFSETAIRDILERHVEPEMSYAIERQLGRGVAGRITAGPIICLYEKDKFRVDLGKGSLEPSLDHLFAFRIGSRAPHPLSTFWEYENEVKAENGDLEAKLERLDELLKFDGRLSREFDLKVERLDKYHRCASCFEPLD
ncbi:MAG: CYTH domain-containing protein [Elusimicrobia bacterium]|nr:CYTH domain-containing protein [Elusimicrobiota bacterium]